MKILTLSQKGVVVELNQFEYREITHLIDAVEGKTFNETYSMEFPDRRNISTMEDTIDLSSVFGAIKAYYEAKFRINELQTQVDILKKSLG